MPELRCYRLASNRAQFMVEMTSISITNLQLDKSGIEKKRGYSNLVLSIVAEIYLQLTCTNHLVPGQWVIFISKYLRRTMKFH